MILVDHQIKHRVSTGELLIGNFDADSVQPATYDLRIGSPIFSPAHADKPDDIAANGGAYRLAPYAMAVVSTYEDLKLPSNLIGRIGLKSGLARTGLFASTGPQIDPGFDGKLFVSLFNLTAAPHVLRFKESFLSIEFHTLDEEPEHSYRGPYQGKRTVGPEVLESIVHLEGLTLSQMQSKFTELAQNIEKWGAFAGKIDRFLTTMERYTNAIQEMLSAPRAVPEPERVARTLSPKAAADEILALFRTRGKLYYSDIADELHLDLSTIIRACELLERKGLIEGTPNGKNRSKKTRR